MISQALGSIVREHADSADRERRLAPAVLDALHEARLFRWLLPAVVGGEQPPFVDWLDTIEAISQADGSTGWALNQGAVFATVAALLPPESAAELWADPRTVICHGPPRATTTTTDTNGDYELQGRWGFGSGCRHASLFAGAASVENESHAQRLFLFRGADLIDNWDVFGLRGTGSFDYEIAATLVPRAHTVQFATDRATDPYPLYRIGPMLAFACSFGAVTLGIARHALDAATACSLDRVPQYRSTSAGSDGHVHDQIGLAETRWRAARALLHETVAEVWGALEEAPRITLAERSRLRMAGTHAMREAHDIGGVAFNVSGGDAIRAEHPVNRPFLDLMVAAQHLQARTANYGLVGRYLLGEQQGLAPMI